MYVLRPIQESDEKAFIDLAFSAHSGITSLPKNKTLLKNKLQKSLESFNNKDLSTKNDLYLFVLEEIEQQILVGTSGIFSTGERVSPSYYYQINQEPPLKEAIQNYPLRYRQYLKLVSHIESCTELCSLFLHPDHRKGGVGKLLSLARFLFIASHPLRFNNSLVANLRGIIDENGKSPFWETIGRHFLNVEFDTTQELVQIDTSIAKSILPENPIYTSLISRKAQQVIGIPHEHSVPAQKMLEKQSFKFINEIDPFDGGPKLETTFEKIPMILNSHVSKIEKIVNKIDSLDTYFLCKNHIQFRGCYGKIIATNDKELTIDQVSAKALKVNIGDSIRFYKVIS